MRFYVAPPRWLVWIMSLLGMEPYTVCDQCGREVTDENWEAHQQYFHADTDV